MKGAIQSFFIGTFVLTLSLFASGFVFAFNGPGSLSPGTGSGAFQVDSNYNVGFGTNLASPTGDATNANFGRVFTIASSSDPGLALRNLSTGGGKYIMFARANGRFAIWDDTAGRPRFFIEQNGNIGIPGSALTFTASSTLHVNGSIQTEAAFVGSVPAASVVAGAFQSSNYAFPSALAVGTSTTAGLPTSGLYVAGNVGIGTISPGQALSVRSASQNAVVNIYGISTTTDYGAIQVSNAGSLANPSNRALILQPNTGNVGIGMAAPTEKLYVNGNLAVSQSGGTVGLNDLTISHNGTAYIIKNNYSGFTGNNTGIILRQTAYNGSGTTDFTFDSAGQLGTSGSSMRFLVNSIQTAAVVTGGWETRSDYGFKWSADTNPGGTADTGLYRGSAGVVYVGNGTNGNYGGTLVAGNVGIATTTPAQKLEVVGNIKISGAGNGLIFPDGTTQTTAGGGGGSSSVGWSRTGTNVYLTTSTDWVGIGTTTPTQALHVQGNAYISGNIVTGGTMTTNVGASNVSAGTFGTTAGKGNYTFEGAATTNAVLKVDATNERVGVGTASPSYTLDVNGIINAATAFRVGGAAPSTSYLRGNGTNFIASTIQASDVPTLNQNTTGSAYYVTSRDTRAVNDLPQDYGPLVKYDFKANGTNGLSDGGSYNGVMTWRKYGSATDLTGGPVMQLAYSDNNNLWTRLSTGTSTWGTWTKILNASSGVSLQSATPGTAQTGHLNISGTGIFGTSVGIGTSTPVQALSVVGNIYATGNISTGGTISANVGAGNVSAGTFGSTAGKGNYTFEAAASSNNVLKVDATNERVGIGTGSPAYNLHLFSSNSAAQMMIEGTSTNYANAAVVFKANGGTNMRAIGDYYFDNSGQNEWFSGRPYNNSDQFIIARKTSVASHDQAVAQTSNALFSILSNGKVGIGTSTPGAMIHALSTTEQLRLGYDNANYGSFTVSSAGDMNYTAGGGDEFDFWNGVTGSNYVDIGQGGSGEKQFRMFNGGGVVNLFSTTGNSYITAGNLGVGTSTPAQKLVVSNPSSASYVQVDSNGGLSQQAGIKFSANYNGPVISEVNFDYYGSYATSTGSVGHGMNFISGRASPFGNYWFRDASSSVGIAFVSPSYPSSNLGLLSTNMNLLVGGNVGIGTTTPAYKLDVNGTGQFVQPLIVGSPSAANHATTKSYVDSLLTGGSTSGSLATLVVTGTTTLASTAGNVTIGGAGPSLKLNVVGQGQFSDTMSATKYYDYDNTSYYIDPANTGTSGKIAGSLQSDGSGTSYIGGTLLVGTNTNPGSYTFAVSGTSYFSNQMTVNANLLMGSSQNITLQSGNITGVNKITAAIIDPLYDIDGKKYATYGSDTIGVKTELFAKGKLISNDEFRMTNESGKYSYIIDFAKAERGSDLWLFWQTVKEGNDMKDVTLTLTPEGGKAALWYELRASKKQIVVYGDEAVTFSYHLVAPRHDAEKWTTNRNTEEKASFILKAK